MEQTVGTMYAGYASVRVDPPMGIHVPGYYSKRASEGFITNLYLRATAFSDGENKAQDEPKADERKSGSHAKQAELIVESLGGAGNIKNLDSCATRLRVTVADPALVSEAGLKKGGALGVIVRGDGVQVVYGPRVTVIKSEVEEWLSKE